MPDGKPPLQYRPDRSQDGISETHEIVDLASLFGDDLPNAYEGSGGFKHGLKLARSGDGCAEGYKSASSEARPIDLPARPIDLPVAQYGRRSYIFFIYFN